MFTRPWLTTDVEYLRQHYGKVPVTELAEQLDRTVWAVRRQAQVSGMTKPHVPAVQTFESIKANCIEVGSCWEWQGSMAGKARSPRVSHEGKNRAVRPLLRELSGLPPLPPSYRLGTSCHNRKCVNPDHMVRLNDTQAMKRAGKFINHPLRIAKVTATRGRKSRVTDDMAHALRNADSKTVIALAKEYGITYSYARRIASGSLRKPPGPLAASMF